MPMMLSMGFRCGAKRGLARQRHQASEPSRLLLGRRASAASPCWRCDRDRMHAPARSDAGALAITARSWHEPERSYV